MAKFIIDRGLLLFGILLSFTCSDASATPFDMGDFARTSGPEFLSPNFDDGSGQTTTKTYSGFVEVLASGFGSPNLGRPDDLTDALYAFSMSTNTPIALFDNTLRLGSQTQIEPLPRGFGFVADCPLHVECGSVHVAELAVAYEGASFPVTGAFPLDVNDGFVPVFDPDHSYRFILDLGTYTGRLTLGIGDGGTFDNAGAYDITLFQAALAPAPEPGSLTLMALGLTGLRFARRRRAG